MQGKPFTKIAGDEITFDAVTTDFLARWINFAIFNARSLGMATTKDTPGPKRIKLACWILRSHKFNYRTHQFSGGSLPGNYVNRKLNKTVSEQSKSAAIKVSDKLETYADNPLSSLIGQLSPQVKARIEQDLRAALLRVLEPLNGREEVTDAALFVLGLQKRTMEDMALRRLQKPLFDPVRRHHQVPGGNGQAVAPQ